MLLPMRELHGGQTRRGQTHGGQIRGGQPRAFRDAKTCADRTVSRDYIDRRIIDRGRMTSVNGRMQHPQLPCCGVPEPGLHGAHLPCLHYCEYVGRCGTRRCARASGFSGGVSSASHTHPACG